MKNFGALSCAASSALAADQSAGFDEDGDVFLRDLGTAGIILKTPLHMKLPSIAQRFARRDRATGIDTEVKGAPLCLAV